MEEPKFERNIFGRYPWLNLAMTILVTILQALVAIKDFSEKKYFWGIIFVGWVLIYIFLMIPMSYRLMKRTIAYNKTMDDLEKRIREIRRREKENYENISKL